MDAIEKLKVAIIEQIKARIPVQSVWAECVSADADKGTMTATANGLEYDDVLLGLGADIAVPAPNSKVLLGLVGNKAEATFLVFAEQVQERRLNGDTFGGLVKADVVAGELAKVQADLNKLKGLMSGWVPVPNDGGASLKTTVASWTGQQLTPTQSGPLQNTVVKHG